MWYYRRTSQGYDVECGHYTERFYPTQEEAEARVNYLNGGLGIGQEQMEKLVALLITAYSPIATVESTHNDNSTASPRRTR